MIAVGEGGSQIHLFSEKAKEGPDTADQRGDQPDHRIESANEGCQAGEQDAWNGDRAQSEKDKLHPALIILLDLDPGQAGHQG